MRIESSETAADRRPGLWCAPEQLEALTAGSSARVLVDRAARIRFATKVAVSTLGLRLEVRRGHNSRSLIDAAAGRSLIDMVAPADLASLLARLASTGDARWQEDVELRLSSGERRALTLRAIACIDDVWTIDVAPQGAIDAEDLLLDLATRLLAPHQDLDDSIRDAIRRLAENMGVDRASVFTFTSEDASSQRAYLWSRDGIGHPDLDPTWWKGYLEEGTHDAPGLVRIDDTATRESTAFLAPQGVRSTVAVRVATGDGMQVSVGMSTRDRVRHWTDADVRAVQSAAAVFGNAIRRAQSEAALQAEHAATEAGEERLRATIDAAPAVILRIDRDTRILLANDESARYGEVAVDELIGVRLADFLGVDMRESFLARTEHLFATGERVESVLRMSTPKSGEVWFDSRGVPEFSPDGTIESMLIFATDVTERRAMEDQIRHAAAVDLLTGLANRQSALERLDAMLAAETDASEARGILAVLFVDIDRFKLTNDSLGHEAGDAVLRSVASAIIAETNTDDIVARLGGDEFAVVLAGSSDLVEVVQRVERIRRAIAEPVTIGNQTVVSTASIGVALASPDDRESAELLRLADVAMYQAKLRGRNRFEVFDAKLRSVVEQRIQTEAALRRALPEHQLGVHYQPEVMLGDGRVVGVEALVRWNHPQRGLLVAGAFVGLAEETGLIADIGRFVLTEACSQVGDWAHRFPSTPLTLRVNVSGRQLAQPALLRDVTVALADSGLDPGRLCLEITETALMSDIDASIQMLRWIRDLGVRLAIDDFGTGYSSLGYLERFPVDALKIDRSFVSGLGIDPKSAAIVRTLLTLAQVLDLDVVAEGVETDDQVAQLRALGCERGQGFLYAPGLAPQDLEAHLERGTIRR